MVLDLLNFCLAIIAFGALGFVFPQMLLSLKENGQEGSRPLNLRSLGSSRKDNAVPVAQSP